MNSRYMWMLAALLAFVTAAIMGFGTSQTVFAGFWVIAGCMFLVFAFALSRRS